MKNSLFLIGMPYVGKSYWGRQLAGHLHVPFTDLDELIEQTSGHSIAEIIAREGEPGFRNREQQCLEALLNNTTTPRIVACGGGTPCFFNNIDIMKQHGTVVWLNAPIPYLLKNAARNNSPRPLLGSATDPEIRLTQLLTERTTWYQQAHHILQVQDISLTTFDKILLHA